MKTTIYTRLLSLCLMIGMAGALALPGAASGTVGFSVQAVIPENQIDKNQSYFDLWMEPGQKQDLEVRVSNSDTQPITVRVSAISASTSANGLIDYQTPGVRDVTLKIPFSEIAEPVEPEIRIPAGETRTAVVRLSMPDETYDGLILGGLLFEKVEEEDGQTSGGTSISNVYNYVVGVQLTETETQVLPEFEMVGVEPGLANYRTAIIHSIRNRTAAIARGVDFDIDIYKKGDAKPLLTVEARDLRMAPNSVMPYAAMWEGDLKPGDYVSNIRITCGGEEWVFRTDFTIDRGQADDINEESVSEGKGGTAPWVMLLILLLILLILLVLFLILLLWKRRKDEEEEEVAKIKGDSHGDDTDRP